MKLLAGCVASILLVCTTSPAQHGTAENGYYPIPYGGDTWTGVVTKVADASREITLTYRDKKHSKTETFVGVLAKGYTVRLKDGTERPLAPSNLKLGTVFTVYYYEDTMEIKGKRTHFNDIFRVRGLPDISTNYLVFRAF